ncbi:MAG TPA: AraC family transcriptional regulator [Ruminococcus sp.]
MDWIKGMQRCINYIEDHITEPMELADIAHEMNVSPFYFQRIFTLVCGLTPGEYIRSRRLALAGSELISTDAKVIDIALKYGYDTPEGFTRAFTRFHGASPNAVKKGSISIKSFSPLQISISMKGGKIMNYRIIEKEAFKVLEKAEIHSIVDNENKNTIPDFWDRAKTDGTLDTLIAAFAPGEKNIYGICYGNSASDNKTFEYSIAAKCTEKCVAPEGFRINEIPARTWAVFECIGPMPTAIQECWHRVITEFFPSSDYEPTYEMDLEVYSEGDTSANDCKSWIYVPVIKK